VTSEIPGPFSSYTCAVGSYAISFIPSFPQSLSTLTSIGTSLYPLAFLYYLCIAVLTTITFP